MRAVVFAGIAALLLGLAGCGRSQSYSGSTSTYPTVVVSESNASRTVSATGSYDLVISGAMDVVTIAPNQALRNVTISGSADDVRIGPSSSVAGSVALTGSNCTLHLPAGSSIVVHDTGSGNQVLYDSAVAVPSEVG